MYSCGLHVKYPSYESESQQYLHITFDHFLIKKESIQLRINIKTQIIIYDSWFMINVFVVYGQDQEERIYIDLALVLILSAEIAVVKCFSVDFVDGN